MNRRCRRRTPCLRRRTRNCRRTDTASRRSGRFPLPAEHKHKHKHNIFKKWSGGVGVDPYNMTSYMHGLQVQAQAQHDHVMWFSLCVCVCAWWCGMLTVWKECLNHKKFSRKHVIAWEQSPELSSRMVWSLFHSYFFPSVPWLVQTFATYLALPLERCILPTMLMLLFWPSFCHLEATLEAARFVAGNETSARSLVISEFESASHDKARWQVF